MPNFYENLPTSVTLSSWTMTRELFRSQIKSTNPRLITSMRMIEQYALWVLQMENPNREISGSEMDARAIQIFERERHLTVADQTVGPFLESLIASSQAYISGKNLTIAATDKAEDILKHLNRVDQNDRVDAKTKMGHEDCTPLFNSLFVTAQTHAATLRLVPTVRTDAVVAPAPTTRQDEQIANIFSSLAIDLQAQQPAPAGAPMTTAQRDAVRRAATLSRLAGDTAPVDNPPVTEAAPVATEQAAVVAAPTLTAEQQRAAIREATLKRLRG
jgi:hypothetical protein